MTTLLQGITVMQFTATLVGLVFMLGAGGVLFAFALSYISQKMAMWIDVMKIVKHRNALIQEVAALRVQVETLEAFSGEAAKDIIAPTEIGVQSVPIGAP